MAVESKQNGREKEDKVTVAFVNDEKEKNTRDVWALLAFESVVVAKLNAFIICFYSNLFKYHFTYHKGTLDVSDLSVFLPIIVLLSLFRGTFRVGFWLSVYDL